MGKSNFKLSAPWITFYHEIEAMFGEDPEIKIVYDEDNQEVKLYVDNPEKAEALTQILPAERVFGNVVLKITVIPANKLKDEELSVFEKALKGNPVLSYVKKIGGTIFVYPASYVVFKNKVVQFFNDELGDVNGYCSTLYQEIANDIFVNRDGVYFCTDIERNLGKPLGEWP